MFPPKPLRQTDLLTLGDARISRITDMDPFALPLTFLFPGAVPEALEAHRSSLAPWHVDFAAGSVLLGVHSLLLQAGGLNILIDTCVGACKPRPARPEWHQRRAAGYLAALSRAGLAPEDIDIVLCTHLHADHVGWNTRLQDGRWVPTFPRARYVIGRQELQDAASAHQA
ncbi:MAG: MBL fold metallo-hydrolase, partial [Paracoccus sp. (in: a-proteobacteria)]